VLYNSLVGSQRDISCQVRRFRRLADLTQEQLAERVGVTRQTILAVEKGKFTPSVALALELAEALGVSVDQLFQLKPNEEAQ
jgi:DNA-binding XRE family transcriptional regulator